MVKDRLRRDVQAVATKITLGTFIDALRQIADAGRPAERRVARVILDDFSFATHSSIGELARRAEVSQPTVTRVCHRAGCAGVKELKILLAGALYSGVPYLAQLVTAGDDLSTIKEKVITGFNHTMEAVDRALELAVLEAAVSALADVKTVVFVGSGPGPSTVVADAPLRFARIGYRAEGHTDRFAQRIAIAALDSPAAIVGISNLGRVDEVFDALQYGRSLGHKTLAITSPQSALALAVDVCIAVPVVEDPHMYFPSYSRLPALMILDVLSTAVSLRLGDEAGSKARRVKEALAKLS